MFFPMCLYFHKEANGYQTEREGMKQMTRLGVRLFMLFLFLSHGYALPFWK